MSRQSKARKIAAKTHKFVNIKRQKHGEDELTGHKELAKNAEGYAKKMADRGRIGHQIGGTTPPQRAASFAGVSENCFKILQAHRNPRSIAGEAANRWMESPGHRDNILRSGFNYSGVGVWLKGNAAYITHMFASRRRLAQTVVELSRSIV